MSVRECVCECVCVCVCVQYSADVESAGRSEQAVGALDAGPGQLVNFQVFFFFITLELRLERYERL